MSRTPASATPATAAPTKAKPSKAETLVKLANRRVPAAIVALGKVARLAAYTPTPEQAAKILKALQTAIGQVEAALDNPKAVKAEGFNL